MEYMRLIPTYCARDFRIFIHSTHIYLQISLHIQAFIYPILFNMSNLAISDLDQAENNNLKQFSLPRPTKHSIHCGPPVLALARLTNNQPFRTLYLLLLD